MSNTKRFLKRSSKGAAVFMSATMILLAVAGDLALPVGVYANENDPGEISLNEGEHQIEIIVDNPEDGELEEVAPYQIMDTNNGYIGDVNGTVNNNNGSIYDVKGTVTTNNDSIETVEGKVTTNKGSIDYVDSQGQVTDNNGDIGNVARNGGVYNNNDKATIRDNYGYVYTNQEGATIGIETKEDGTRGNYGSVENNYGTVIFNGYLEGVNESPVIEHNYGTVKYNDLGGKITINEKSGFVKRNGGNVRNYNGEDPAVIDKNYGTVNENTYSGKVNFNYGTIINNNNGSLDTNAEDGIVKSSSGIIDKNYGEIEENSIQGEVYDNFGNIKNNKHFINNNKCEKDKSGVIESNSKTVRLNESGALIKENTKSGVIEQNQGTVNDNKGTIDYNWTTVENNTGTVVTNIGVVLNYESGIVETNNGEVYNYGGTIGTNNGTEYFSVDLVHNDFVTISSTNNNSGLSDAYNKKWIRQNNGKTNTVTLLITPAKNYKIDKIEGLDENYVTADKQKDGSWLLTISSGANLKITIPDPVKSDTNVAPINNNTGDSEPVPLKPVIITDPDPNPDPGPDPETKAAPTPTPNQIQLSDSDPIEAMLTNATWNGSIIVLSDSTSVSLDNLAVADCSVIQTDLLENTEMAQVYESVFLIAIESGASVKDARSMAFDTARVMADYFEKDLPRNYTPEQAAMYKKAYIKAFVRTVSEGKTLKKARNAARSAGNNVINQELLRQVQEDIANTESQHTIIEMKK